MTVPPRRPGFEPGSGHVGFVVEKVALGLFPLPIFIPPIAAQSPSPIIWGWYNRPVVASAPSGLSLTPLRIVYVGCFVKYELERM
jgi:hypothetical protein